MVALRPLPTGLASSCWGALISPNPAPMIRALMAGTSTESTPAPTNVWATSSASTSARWKAHTKLSPTAVATAFSSSAPISAHTRVGSQESITFSVCWVMARKRPRRSCSMSAVRSAIPSLRICCHSAVCARASCASALRRSRSARSASRAAGSSSASSSAPTARRRCSAAERISATTWSRMRSFSREATCSDRKFTSAGKLDSVLSSLSLVLIAWLRSTEDTGMIGTATPACCRCRSSAATTSRQYGYRSVLVATMRATGQICTAWRRNVISGSVNSWLVSLTISTASASGSRPSVADRWG